jgi:hypothetical protein
MSRIGRRAIVTTFYLRTTTCHGILDYFIPISIVLLSMTPLTRYIDLVLPSGATQPIIVGSWNTELRSTKTLLKTTPYVCSNPYHMNILYDWCLSRLLYSSVLPKAKKEIDNQNNMIHRRKPHYPEKLHIIYFVITYLINDPL